ncbi:MAG TPA: hypothetical protein VFQ38_00075, partial [Longimicrobiales bacterium]|nr:hypothetical protein [Longimicrobiales bacterium]
MIRSRRRRPGVANGSPARGGTAPAPTRSRGRRTIRRAVVCFGWRRAVTALAASLAVLTLLPVRGDAARVGTPDPPPVTTGADRLFTEFAHLIRGKRVALVSNHSGRLADGTHLADALHRFPGV